MRSNLTHMICLGFALHLMSCGVFSEELPQGRSGDDAEHLAYRVWQHVNAKQFWLAQGAKWQFIGHHYLWHKGTGRVRVKLSESLVVYLELTTDRVKARCDGEWLEGHELAEAQQEAIKAFNNDSFWAFAPFKIFDDGTRRSLVPSALGPQLLVTYDRGGSTPGDQYLWQLDEQGQPKAWKMWVSIIPIGGMEATWSDWQMTSSGARVASKHKILGISLDIKDVNITEYFEELKDLDPLLIDGW